jgi:hypothetical protein
MVEGSPLAGHRRRRAAQGHRRLDIRAGKRDLAALVVDNGDGAVNANLVDRPALAVLDLDARVGDERSVVLPGLHFITDERGRAVGERHGADRPDDLARGESKSH